jgi:hypothetical protein
MTNPWMKEKLLETVENDRKAPNLSAPNHRQSNISWWQLIPAQDITITISNTLWDKYIATDHLTVNAKGKPS